jgi:hypothetical protein
MTRAPFAVPGSILRVLGGSLLVCGLVVVPAAAQPYGSWIVLDSAHPAWIEIPHHAQLNPASTFTLEAWVSLAAIGPGQCRSLVGKDFQQSWWMGVCDDELRSFLRGDLSMRQAGDIPANEWAHVAVVFTGDRRIHYINGEVVGEWPETGPLTSSTAPVQIGHDVAWPFTPTGSIDEVRLWNVARNESQIRATINQEIRTPQPGLVAVWGMNGGADALGNHPGSLHGGPGFLTFPVAPGCVATPTSMCLRGRFSVTIRWQDFADHTGPGRVVYLGPFASADSGLFWFFDPDNWEFLVKILDACSLNNRYWVFFAATTNVGYRLEVMDVAGGARKIYFNYLGDRSPAMTDTNALATCP